MSIVSALMVGALLGWLVGWYLDRKFWNRQRVSISEHNTRAELLSADLDSARKELEQLRDQLNHGTLTQDPEQPSGRLETIKGIGPAFAKRLRAAGIATFADLAALTEQQLSDIIDAQAWQRIDPATWLSEAARLSASATE